MRLNILSHLSPLTRKRLQNFARIRRAVIALALLIGLFVISLFSNFICNSSPLFLRYEGRTYFPFLKSITQADLNGGKGEVLPVDFKAFTASEAFTSNPANRVVWAPIPFSPGDVINAESLSEYRTVRISIVPDAAVGRFDLTRPGNVIRPVACDPYFPGVKTIEGARLQDYWQLPDDLTATLNARFEGKSVSAERFTLTSRDGQRRAVVSLPPLPERKDVEHVRLAICPEGKLDTPLAIQVRRSAQGELIGFTFPAGVTVAPAAAERIRAMALESFDHPVPPEAIDWRNGRKAAISCVLSPIAWPFRPVKGHWMGIDSAGRDVLARVLYGMRIALSFGLVLALWAMFFGVLIGSIQGYFGGWADIIGQRLTEIWHALPFLYVMIFIGSALGRSFALLLICYGIFNWIGISYYMRAEFLRLRQRTFVEAARCQGLSPLRIIFLHILPNALTPLITLFPFNLMGAIGSLAALDFLGFGLPPMTPSWGELLHQAQLFRWAWWLILFPAAALFCVMLLAVIVGEGLRDAFDPRQQSKLE